MQIGEFHHWNLIKFKLNNDIKIEKIPFIFN